MIMQAEEDLGARLRCGDLNGPGRQPLEVVEMHDVIGSSITQKPGERGLGFRMVQLGLVAERVMRWRKRRAR